MTPKPRCKVCRRILESADRSACPYPGPCLRTRDSWEWNPCPAERCEFAAPEHVSHVVEDVAAWVCPDGWKTPAT